MLQLPMLPDWKGIHPLLIHFPLTLFFVAPLFLSFASFTRNATRRTFLTSALTVMLLGVVSMYVAFEAGNRAAATVDEIAQFKTIVERHRELASLARESLTASTVLFGLTFLICGLFQLHLRELSGVLSLGSLTFYGLGLFWLTNAAYYGERLVHE